MLRWPTLPEQILKPRENQLRQFALVLPLAAAALCWGLGAAWSWTLVILATSVIAAGIGWRYPAFLRIVYVGLSLAAFPIGLIVGELVLLSVYFGLITPIGLVFRLLRRDALERTIDRQAASYWRPKQHARQPSSYLRRW